MGVNILAKPNSLKGDESVSIFNTHEKITSLNTKID